MIKRRSFFGAFAGLLAWRPGKAEPALGRRLANVEIVPELKACFDIEAARAMRYEIAKDWPRERPEDLKRRQDFITKGEITGFTYRYNFFVGHTWNNLYRPHKIGDTVCVRKFVSMVSMARKIDGHTFYDLDPAEQITLTPEFLITNGFERPTVAEMYLRGRTSQPLEYGGWAEPSPIQPGDIITIAGVNVENPRHR